MLRRSPPVAAAIFVLCLIALLQWRDHEDEIPSVGTGRAAKVKATPSAIAEFSSWMTQRRSGTRSGTTPEEIDLALLRKAAMLDMIEHDPAGALRSAVTWSEYHSLPAAIRAHVERPFNTIGHLNVLPVCGAKNLAERRRVYLLEMVGRTYDASVFGRRLGIGSKENTPLAGITLDGRAAVREFAFELLTAADAHRLAHLPLANPDPTLCISTGAVLDAERCVALAGGERFLFTNAETLAAFNDGLAEFDRAPSPHAGARIALQLADGIDGDPGAGFDWGAADEGINEEASSWTETVKDVFFIRVDFSDVPGEVVSQAALAGVLNTTASDNISDQSYGKTWINAGVSATTVRMPSPSTSYLPNSTTSLHNDAKNAYEAIAGAGALAPYDIVGVHFPSIGLKSGTFLFTGLATLGGSRHWLQGTTNPKTIIHEFGHNYGVGHASFWDTSDGSVVGAGTSSEYGDPFDMMGSGGNPEGHFHMQAKSRLNWLVGTQWVDADAAGSGTYRIYPFDNAATTGINRGLRALKASSPDEFYWLGYRPGIPDNAYLSNGAYVVWQQPGMTRSWLLDTTPNSPAAKQDAAIALGTTYSDTTAGVHFTPLANGGSGADSWIDVNVQLGAFAGNSPPTVTLSAPASLAARSATNLSVVTNDADGDPLAYSWDFGDDSLSPNSDSVSKTWSVGGSYPVSVTVSDMKGGTATDTAIVTVTDPLDTWTTGTVVAGRDLDVVEYLDGRFIASGNKYAYLSFDGDTWLESYLTLNFFGSGIAADGTNFVIAGRDWNGSAWIGALFYSTDGAMWQSATAPASQSLRDVASGNGVFVAVGDNATLLRSADGGQTWTAQTAPGPESLDAIAFGSGTFVAVGETSIYTSTDGIAWTDRSAGTQLLSWQSFDDVAFFGGTFYAGGWNSGIHYSNDGGQTWTPSAMPSSVDYDIDAIAVADGVLTAAADRLSAPNGPVLLVSADGLTWAESGATFPDTSSLTYGDGVFMAVYGTSGASSQSDLIDATNSAPTASLTAPSTANARTAVGFTAVSSDPDTDPLTLVWNFGDGTPLQEGASVSHTFGAGGSYSVQLLATDTRGGVTTATQLITIADPLDNWTQRPSGTTASLSDIAYGAGTLVAVGGSSGNSGAYLVSTDGSTWTGGTIGTNVRLRGAIHDGAKFIAAGFDYDFGIPAWVGAIYTSVDGSAWTRRHFGGEELNDLAFGTGVYIASGDAGTLLRSTDGLSWSPVASGVGDDLHGTSFGAGEFVAVGAGSGGGPVIVLTSPDGLAWADRSVGAGTAGWQGFYDVQFCNDRFLASGWFSKIRHSNDAGVNFSTTQSGTQQIPAFAYGNATYLAAGIDKDNSDADINLISTDGETWTTLTTPPQGDRNGAVFFNSTFITVGDGGEIWQSDAFSAPSAGGFTAWLAIYFPGGSGPTDDPDGDGSKNLVEYGNDTDPTDADEVTTPSAEIAGDYLTITIPKSPAATDLTYGAEFSEDLQNWSAANTVIVSETATELVVRTTFTVSSLTEFRGFLRATYTVPD